MKRRLRALEDLRAEGYQVGSGFMVGLPGETEETRIANALLCAELELDMVGIGPFIPHPATPLAGSKQETIELTLRMTSLLRTPHARSSPAGDHGRGLPGPRRP